MHPATFPPTNSPKLTMGPSWSAVYDVSTQAAHAAFDGVCLYALHVGVRFAGPEARVVEGLPESPTIGAEARPGRRGGRLVAPLHEGQHIRRMT